MIGLNSALAIALATAASGSWSGVHMKTCKYPAADHPKRRAKKSAKKARKAQRIARRLSRIKP